MKIVIVKPDEEPYTEEIDGELEEMQEIVGGDIEVTSDVLMPGVVIVCNEEGKLLGLPANRIVSPTVGSCDVIHGDFFVCSVCGEEFEGLSDIDAESVIDWFSL